MIVKILTGIIIFTLISQIMTFIAFEYDHIPLSIFSIILLYLLLILLQIDARRS